MVGSFLNCVIFRLKEGEGFLRGRSRCPHCKHPLAWYDLIPVLSFIILRRHCRYCKKPISYQYPLVELVMGALFVLVLWHLTFDIDLAFDICHLDFLTLIYYLLITCFLIVIFVYDLKHFIVPDKVLYPAIIISLIYRLIDGLLQGVNFEFPILNFEFFNSLFAATIVSGFFFLIYFISKGRWLGFGDVKLGILLGLVLGWPKVLLALFLSFVIGGIIGIGLIILGKKKLKSEVPFAPFLIMGALIALFWGEQIVTWYLSLMLY
jgi:prepilin signal peptidase PulO-like enzyme (type II secretory pathway)